MPGFPERLRFRLRDDYPDKAIRLELPDRRMWIAGGICAVMFAIFASVAWSIIVSISRHSVRDVFDLTTLLFQLFWVLGWSVGVVILGALTVFFFFYSESVRLQDGRLVHVTSLGALKVIAEYNLARIRNLRLENAGGENTVRIRFDYDEGSNGLGDTMSRDAARVIVDRIKEAGQLDPIRLKPDPTDERIRLKPDPTDEGIRLKPDPTKSEEESPSILSLSGLALIGANLVPLAGVLLFGWDLASVMVLFWAESVVIGFYTALKMAIVGNVLALVAVPFFVGHFGGFLAGHFLLIYSFFIRGADATGPAPGAWEALRGIFIPIWPALAALFISHGQSFVENFLGRGEYARTTMKDLMTAPYNRIVVMQLALIFGGWIIILLKNPVPALALLVLFKIVLDFTAHRKEHSSSRSTIPPPEARSTPGELL